MVVDRFEILLQSQWLLYHVFLQKTAVLSAYVTFR